MESIKIRRAELQDAEMLTELCWKTFWDAFHDNPKNAPEDLADYMRSAFCLKQIRSELSDENAIFLVAEIENEAVGYAKLLLESREPEITAEKPIELNRLYSKQEFLGRGVGKSLMEKCLEEAEKHNCDLVWLGVWEFNPRAQAFYRKYGFQEVGKHTFLLGSDAQTDLLMQKKL
ncbi:MAG: GNAT family N-acetyltransferase [Acidobacteria bacterium]|jgi:ribosomal protein S18 acetylase RimI-like enzyme|nr:GNAT family N-acetyltransferase [Acidobacteriota bacterium]